MTYRQEEIKNWIEQAQISSGKRNITFKLEINDKGGAWIDFIYNGRKSMSATIFIGLTNKRTMRLIFQDERNWVNPNTKKNAAVITELIEKVLSW